MKKVYAMLGMAMKAGKVASGEFSTEKSVKGGLAVTDENFARAISKRLEQAGKQIDNNANSHLERV